MEDHKPSFEEQGQLPALIEGGEVASKAGEDRILVRPPFDEEKHRGAITVWLIALLAVVVLGNYVCVMILEWNGRKIDAVASAFNASLPVLSGLVGSAVAYYFTKSDRK